MEDFNSPDSLFPPSSPQGSSSGRPRFRDERVPCCDEDPSLGSGSRFAAFAAPLVTRPLRISVKFEPVLVIGHPAEARTSLLGGQHDGFVAVIGPGSINRGSIFAISKSREEAGVSVPCRVSGSVDASLEEPSLG